MVKRIGVNYGSVTASVRLCPFFRCDRLVAKLTSAWAALPDAPQLLPSRKRQTHPPGCGEDGTVSPVQQRTRGLANTLLRRQSVSKRTQRAIGGSLVAQSRRKLPVDYGFRDETRNSLRELVSVKRLDRRKSQSPVTEGLGVRYANLSSPYKCRRVHSPHRQIGYGQRRHHRHACNKPHLLTFAIALMPRLAFHCQLQSAKRFSYAGRAELSAVPTGWSDRTAFGEECCHGSQWNLTKGPAFLLRSSTPPRTITGPASSPPSRSSGLLPLQSTSGRFLGSRRTCSGFLQLNHTRYAGEARAWSIRPQAARH
jgi:hypothetical protein